jgi:hypothetical protein
LDFATDINISDAYKVAKNAFETLTFHKVERYLPYTVPNLFSTVSFPFSPIGSIRNEVPGTLPRAS